MNSTLKLWTQLGLGTALAGGLLVGCSGGEAGGEAGEAASASTAAATAGEGEGGAGEGEAAAASGGEGEGGEGEGGVAVADAAKDPVAYGIALAVAEAHAAAARDAYAAGNKQAAGEMFAHPVSEVLLDMDPVFARLGVADFKPLFISASDAALAGKSSAEVNAAYDKIIAALRAAALKAPQNRASPAKVATGVIADMIERSSAMYRSLAKQEGDEPYLDGYGFSRAAANAFAASGGAIKAANPEGHARIAEALALLTKAYPLAKRPGKLAVEPGVLSGASAKVMLAAGS
jgi:hypothetical protein